MDKRPAKRLRTSVTTHPFLDLEAAVNYEDTEEESGESDLEEFIEDAAISTSHDSGLYFRSITDQVSQRVHFEAEELARAFEARDREVRQSEKTRYYPDDPDITDVERLALLPTELEAGIWRLPVEAGFEYDVVRTISAMALGVLTPKTILSAFAAESNAGFVYVESFHEDAVSTLRRSVAHVRRSAPIFRVPTDDYPLVLKPKPTRLLAKGSWVRLVCKGPYKGRLGWIEDVDEDSRRYTIWSIPIFLTPSTPSHHKRYCRRDQKHLSMKVGGTGSFLAERDKILVHQSIPEKNITDHVGKPTDQDLASFTETLVTCGQGEDSSAQAFTSSVKRLVAEICEICPAAVGDPVKITTGLFAQTFGHVVGTDSNDRIVVDVGITEIVLKRTEVKLNFSIGDSVKIIHGVNMGQLGWVVHVDWDNTILTVVKHTAADDLPSVNNADSEWKLPISYANFTDALIGREDALSDTHMPSVDREHRRQARLLWMDVIFTKGVYKNLVGQVVDTHRRGGGVVDSVTVRIYARNNSQISVGLDHLIHKDTRFKLEKVLNTPAPIIAEIVKNLGRSLPEPDALAFGNEPLQNAAASWPAVFTVAELTNTHADVTSYPQCPTTQSPPVAGPSGQCFSGPSQPIDPAASSGLAMRSKRALLDEEAKVATNWGTPAGKAPGEWLLQPELKGFILDVVIRNSTAYGGKYDNSPATLTVPKDGRKLGTGRRENSVKVRVGNIQATDVPIKVWTLFPMHTTEYDPVIPASIAKPIFEVAGVDIVVIGPDAAGNQGLVGKRGFTLGDGSVEGGSINIGGQIHTFHVMNVCRSDGLPRGPQVPPMLR